MGEHVVYMSERLATLINMVNAKLREDLSFVIVEPAPETQSSEPFSDPAIRVRYDIPEDGYADVEPFNEGDATIYLRDEFYGLLDDVCDIMGLEARTDDSCTYFWFEEKDKPHKSKGKGKKS